MRKKGGISFSVYSYSFCWVNIAMNYGLVFFIGDLLFLAEYDELGQIQDGENIDDRKEIYSGFGKNQLSIVEVHHYQQDVFYLKDLKTVTISNGINKTVHDLMKEGHMVDLARMIYDKEIKCLIQ
jgi:hypothetical protein